MLTSYQNNCLNNYYHLLQQQIPTMALSQHYIKNTWDF